MGKYDQIFAVYNTFTIHYFATAITISIIITTPQQK